MRRLQISHLTTYEYADTVTLLPHRLLLRPREGHEIRIESAELIIAPAHQLQWQRDVYDNAVAEATFTQRDKRLSIESHLTLQHYDSHPLNFLVADYAVRFPFQYDAAELIDLGPYLTTIFTQDKLQLSQWLRQFWIPGQVVETYLLLEWINKAIATGFTYQQREEPGVQSPATTLAHYAGSCRDFATLFIEACHYLGLAARFVSGYQYSPGLMKGQGSTHAWSEVYLPGAGWKGFDSTTGEVVGNNHIALAVSRHPELVPPVSGSFIAATDQTPVMHVMVEVTDISAMPLAHAL
ncbi:transglutaminase family protein [Methylicorpusculum sp.]|uniref:transglutaminase family protein n=1 Tax=Methylicorpusculum sp. TaxID=2713644 RepID=UPI002730C7B0|nr:transglutaminase family protein [Methylicorpusculum sp.]MDP2180789.1 transglutaminase family protein [Methylicorpusculum sp.]MDP3527900.1 transglutaminase family protein [Methylicorpusculum sp.]MDZ4153085.1 transglutaminase family protein [Methylicorpusculum sp.]